MSEGHKRPRQERTKAAAVVDVAAVDGQQQASDEEEVVILPDSADVVSSIDMWQFRFC